MTWQAGQTSQRVTISRTSGRQPLPVKGIMLAIELTELPEVSDRKTLSACIKISVPTLARWAVEGKGPRFRKAGSRCLYLREDVLAWLESLSAGGSAP